MQQTKTAANPVLDLFSRFAPGAKRVIQNPIAQDVAGAGAGLGAAELLSRSESSALDAAGLHMGHVGETGTRLVNYPLLALLGTRFGRRGLLQRETANGALKYDALKMLNTGAGKGMLAGVPILADQAAQFAGNLNQAAKGFGDLGQATSRAAQTFEKTVSDSGKDISSATKDLAAGAKGLGGAGVSMKVIDADAIKSMTEAPKQLTNELGKIRALGENVYDSVSSALTPKNIAIGVGGTLGAVGVYQLVRDWLNRRNNKEQEQKPGVQPVTKTANWAFVRRLLGAGAGAGAEAYMTKDLEMDPIARGAAVTMGGLSGLKWTAPGIRGYMGAGGTDLATKNFLWTIGGFSAPRLLDAAQKGNTALGLANEKARMGLAGGESNLLRNLGITALGAGGLYALTQIGRAANRVADGQPISSSEVNVVGGPGGSAAPAAPIVAPESPAAAPAPAAADRPDGASGPAGSMGTLRVTLPTRSAKDHETQVEIPLEQIGLSGAIMQRIRRDTKRRLRSEGDERTHRLIPANPSIIKAGSDVTLYGDFGEPVLVNAESAGRPLTAGDSMRSMGQSLKNNYLRNLLLGGSVGAGMGLGSGIRRGNIPGETLAGAGLGAIFGGTVLPLLNAGLGSMNPDLARIHRAQREQRTPKVADLFIGANTFKI